MSRDRGKIGGWTPGKYGARGRGGSGGKREFRGGENLERNAKWQFLPFNKR